jgi:uncharacterized protein (TIGR03083 family)
MTEPQGTAARTDGERAEEKDRLVALLAHEWSEIASLLAGLDDEQWASPALPGWDVHDVVAHLVGTERMLAGSALPSLPAGSAQADHVRNDIGRVNEAWAGALRNLSNADLLAEFRAVTAQRLNALTAMTPDDFDAPSWTPVGDATYGRFMQVRVFDCWMHEQDIRAAVGAGGHEDGDAARQALDEVVRALGYIIGKRGRAPDGCSVLISLSGPIRRDLHVVVQGRARVVDALEGAPTASLTLSSSLFLRLAGGREDVQAALAHIDLGGDLALARQLATNLAFTM